MKTTNETPEWVTRAIREFPAAASPDTVATIIAKRAQALVEALEACARIFRTLSKEGAAQDCDAAAQRLREMAGGVS